MGALAEQKKAITNKGGIETYIDMYMDKIKAALPNVGITPERFARLVLSSMNTNPQLKECTPASVLGAMMQCAQMGMEPNTTGQAYLIPYKNWKTGVTECQYQLGYKGLIELAYRSGKVKTIYAEAVHANDKFVYSRGFDAKLEHEPLLTGDRGAVVAYYAVWKGENGIGDFCVMSIEDIEAHRQKYSKAKNSPWNSDFDAMAKKTCLKQVLKYAPLSVEFRHDLDADETVKKDISSSMMDVPNEFVAADYTVGDADDSEFIGKDVDFETGEVKEGQ